MENYPESCTQYSSCQLLWKQSQKTKHFFLEGCGYIKGGKERACRKRAPALPLEQRSYCSMSLCSAMRLMAAYCWHQCTSNANFALCSSTWF